MYILKSMKPKTNSKWIYFLDGYVYTSYSTAGNGLAQFISVNFHPANALENKDSLGCVRFSYLLQGDEKSSLKVSD